MSTENFPWTKSHPFSNTMKTRGGKKENSRKNQHFKSYFTFSITTLSAGSQDEILLPRFTKCVTFFAVLRTWHSGEQRYSAAGVQSPVFQAFKPNKQMVSLTAAARAKLQLGIIFSMGHLRTSSIPEAQKAKIHILDGTWNNLL